MTSENLAETVEISESDVTAPVLKNATAWSHELGVLIADPDGWDRRNLDVSWAEEITLEEFNERASMSTLIKLTPEDITRIAATLL